MDIQSETLEKLCLVYSCLKQPFITLQEKGCLETNF